MGNTVKERQSMEHVAGQLPCWVGSGRAIETPGPIPDRSASPERFDFCATVQIRDGNEAEIEPVNSGAQTLKQQKGPVRSGVLGTKPTRCDRQTRDHMGYLRERCMKTLAFLVGLGAKQNFRIAAGWIDGMFVNSLT
jgi:hypothetical protein